jgi:hypothetical protein
VQHSVVESDTIVGTVKFARNGSANEASGLLGIGRSLRVIDRA